MNTLRTESPTIEDEITAARARAQAKRQAELEQATAAAAARKEDIRDELIKKLTPVLPGWMLEYVLDETDIDIDTGIEFIVLALPGCSPFQLNWDMRFKHATGFDVWQPLRLEWDEFWWVRRMLTRAGSLDEAIDVAASYGESWHEMHTEAVRRNEQGLSPEPHEPPPDHVAQVGQLLAEFAAGTRITVGHIERDNALLLGSQLYAIATQLQRIANALEADRG